MKRVYSTAFLTVLAGLSFGSVTAIEPYVCSRSEVSGVSLDLTSATIRIPASAEEIFPFVYNNTPGWIAGGDLASPAAVIEVEPMEGDAGDPGSWTAVDGEKRTIATLPGESSAIWYPSGQHLYRAKMTVGGEELCAYFDLTGTTGIKPPIFDMTIVFSAEKLEYTADPVRPDISIITPDGRTLEEGVDYALSFSDDTNVGTCVVTLTGIGAYCGVAYGNYEISYPLVASSFYSLGKSDFRADTALKVDLPAERIEWAWNSAAGWPVGGNDETVDVTYIPLAGSQAEPDESLRRTLFTVSGEDSGKVREPYGWCLLEMGALSRRVYFGHKGMGIFLR